MSDNVQAKAAITAAWIAGILGCVGVVLAAIIGLGLPYVQKMAGHEEAKTVVVVVTATPVSTPAAVIPAATPAQGQAELAGSVAPQALPMSTPEQAVREYFAFIIERKYDVTFSRLTDNYKRNKLRCSGISWRDCPAYSDWANRFTEVTIYDISRLDPLSTTINRVHLLIDIEFVGHFGKDRYQRYQIFMIPNSTQSQWMIDETILER